MPNTNHSSKIQRSNYLFVSLLIDDLVAGFLATNFVFASFVLVDFLAVTAALDLATLGSKLAPAFVSEDFVKTFETTVFL